MSEKEQPSQVTDTSAEDTSNPGDQASTKIKPTKEIGGREGPEPTRYGDWEKNGIISDF